MTVYCIIWYSEHLFNLIIIACRFVWFVLVQWEIGHFYLLPFRLTADVHCWTRLWVDPLVNRAPATIGLLPPPTKENFLRMSFAATWKCHNYITICLQIAMAKYNFWIAFTSRTLDVVFTLVLHFMYSWPFSFSLLILFLRIS